MELFKSGLKTVLGHSEPGPELSGAETVERLVERLRSSTLLEDRRDACRGLKAMSKKFRVEVGAQGMNDLMEVLTSDASDIELVSYALDSLCNITNREPFDEEEDIAHPEIGDQFTEILIKSPENVHLVVGLIAEYDFKIRYPAVRLLTNLLSNRPRELQDLVLVSPMAVSKMMDLLNDPREVVRNDALIMLTQLTKGNANLQKIVAFEGAFDRLYDVIVQEGAADGGIVVEDCLLLMLNLLRNNASNQSFFREGSYMQKLTPFFDMAGLASPAEADVGWSAQKVSNVHHQLQVVRTLVSPSNPKQDTAAAQRVMHASGLLTLLCQMLMASCVPADVLTETINTVAEMIRGSDVNQQFFAQVLAPSEPPRPAIVVLLMSMVNEKQPFSLRCAVLYCFQCYLYRNQQGQAAVVRTLMPSPTAQASDITAGQLLCGGLFSAEPVSSWLSAVALSHTLVNNAEQRSQLLRVQLATSVGNPPVSLLQQSLTILQQTTRLQTRAGLLMLLGTWLCGCTAAVNQLLAIPSTVPYLMSQLNSNESEEQEQLCQGVCAFIMGLCVISTDNSVTNYTKEDLVQLIERRVGVEAFLNKLGQVMKHELYSRSLKHPQLSVREPRQLVFEHEFCRLFKAQEGAVIRVVTMDDEEANSHAPSPEAENDSEMVQRYKQLIRQQDEEIAGLRSSLNVLQAQTEARTLQNDELTAAVSQLRDQNTLLRAQISTDPNRAAPAADGDTSASLLQQQMALLSDQHVAQTDDWRRRVGELETEKAELQHLLQLQQQETVASQTAPGDSSVAAIGQDNRPVSAAAAQTSQEVDALTIELASLQTQNQQVTTEFASLQTQNHQLTAELVSLRQQNDHLSSELQSARLRIDQLTTELAESRVLNTSHVEPDEVQQLRRELEELRREQEDLLVLLTDQEARQQEYKHRLRQLGQQVDDDDDD